MKRANKKIILLIMILCVFWLAGCKYIHIKTYKANENTGSADSVTQAEDNNKNSENDKVTAKADKSGNDTDITSIPSAVQPVANEKLMIYTVNNQTTELEPVTAMIPDGEKITPELIVKNVVESMADNNITVEYESVTTKDDAVIVNFKADKPPLKKIGAELESAILDAIAQSLTENLKEYTKVIYRVEGKAYQSDHIEFGIDEPYYK